MLSAAHSLSSDSQHLKLEVDKFVSSVKSDTGSVDEMVRNAAGFIKTLDSDMQERRKARRISYTAPVSITVDGKTFSSALIDISTTGARLKAVPGIRVGSAIGIAMPDGRPVGASVVWLKPDAFGVKFAVEQKLPEIRNSRAA